MRRNKRMRVLQLKSEKTKKMEKNYMVTYISIMAIFCRDKSSVVLITH